MTHRDLCQDLARVKDTIFIEVTLGAFESKIARARHSADPVEMPQRADVVRIRPSYSRFCLDIYEVKLSRADFLRDIRSDKWRGYLPHCHRFYFAVDSGVAEVSDIPDEAGLIVRGERGWSTVKAAAPRDVDLSLEVLQALLFYRQKVEANVLRRHYLSQFRFQYDNLKRLGKRIARALNFEQKYMTKDSGYPSPGSKIEVLESYFDDGEEAKQMLRDAGYGWSGLSLLETVKLLLKEKVPVE